MPYDELLNWGLYLKARPVEWREDNRTYMLLSAQGVKEKPERLFTSLRSMKQHEENSVSPENRLASTLVSSGLLERLKGVASKNNIQWNLEDSKN